MALTPSVHGGWEGRSDGPSAAWKRRPIMRYRTRLLGGDNSCSHWRRSEADTILCFHEGAALQVYIRDIDGLRVHLLGADLSAGHIPQITVPGGAWQAVNTTGQHTLWSEASIPDLDDWVYLETSAVATGDRALWPENPPAVAGTSVSESLDLVEHIEGGYFRQLYENPVTVPTEYGSRTLANTIFYLLDRRSSVGYLHRNRSDITHFLHSGGPIHYLLLSPEGELVERVLGTDIAAGQVVAFTCPGGWWKTSVLPEIADHGLISEIVAPGFDYQDQAMARTEDIEKFPEHAERLRPYLSHRRGVRL
ncbi:cupin domain-containing protein [Nocardia terpenica]|uniref:DUF985 domain-containing protein n=1 Tax=Nocardia terpenica TaxID=455432 RepID=A0A291RQ16_9NOCA|nr:cupin domain-containing protein [Nocardia terpenica]ATL69379.1 hypothetical protein CRH09_27550 [Nocardia terpenica]